MDSVFARARIRYILPTAILGSIVPYFVARLFSTTYMETLDTTFKSVALGIASYLTLFTILWLGWCSNLKVSDVFGTAPSKADSRALLILGVPLVGTALFFFYLLFIPLSYIAPEFVVWWAVQVPELLVPLSRPNALVINVTSVVLVVIAAPVVEEFIFRGFLFGRLREKYGTTSSILITSILFSVLHPDILGALLFAIVACLVRIRFDSLVAPILVHAGGNAFVVFLTSVDLFIFNAEYQYTLEEFRAYWWLAPVGGIVGFPWLYRYYNRELVNIRWRKETA